MKRCTVLLILAALGACSSDDPTAPAVSLQGIWAGVVEGPQPTSLRLTLIEEGGATVSGTVELGTLTADVEGVHDHPFVRLDVELMLTLDDSLWFEGELVARDSMHGYSHSRVVVTQTDTHGNVHEEVSRDSAVFWAIRQ